LSADRGAPQPLVTAVLFTYSERGPHSRVTRSREGILAITVSQNGSSNGHVAAIAPRRASIKELLAGPKAAVLFGVHNALGAKIAEEAGADGLWISSFEVHAAHRLPDADILGTQDYIGVVQQIVDRVTIPVFVDGNAGG